MLPVTMKLPGDRYWYLLRRREWIPNQEGGVPKPERTHRGFAGAEPGAGRHNRPSALNGPSKRRAVHHVTNGSGQPISSNMPSAKTMLNVYQRQVADSRGAGLAGLNEQARLSPTIRALLEVVDQDHDPRR